MKKKVQPVKKDLSMIKKKEEKLPTVVKEEITEDYRSNRLKHGDVGQVVNYIGVNFIQVSTISLSQVAKNIFSLRLI